MLSLAEAVEAEVRRRGQPVITWFEIERLVRRLYRERQLDGQPLSVRGPAPSPRTLVALRARLVDSRGLTGKASTVIRPEDLRRVLEEDAATRQPYLLAEDPDFLSSVCRVTGIPDGTPEELCCLVDPWCYVSHLSAMQQWSLTDRNPAALHLTRPDKAPWRQRAKAEIRDEYGDEGPGLGQLAPRPRERVAFPRVLRGRALSVFEPGFFGRSVAVPDSPVRVATVGQTFRDMLHEPALCGGMGHVLDVWEEHAATYLEEIIEAMDDPALKATKIASVRAGHILAERLGLQDPRIDAWAAFAERGGSRKLDPERPFHPSYSERWMLSLNA